MWRFIIQDPKLTAVDATYVCVDMPGYGGSDTFDVSDTAVLEALSEFIIAMRDQYLDTDEQGNKAKNTIVVAHDWGGAMACRLASEAPNLADRFILTNAPHVSINGLEDNATDFHSG
jgi:pimeloyl-ACP methyl ester carboxylesterase